MRLLHHTAQRIFLFLLDRIRLIRREISYIQGKTGDFSDGYFYCKRVFFIENIDSHDSGGNYESNVLIVDALYFQRLEPGSERDLGELMINLDLA